MMKKVLCVVIVGILLLVTTNVVSKPTNKIKENDEATKQVETQILNSQSKDCPCQNEQSNSDSKDLIWYPGKFVTCGVLRFITFIVGILQPNTPWGLIALAQSLECDWALNLPIP